jgi:hypothetical protein
VPFTSTRTTGTHSSWPESYSYGGCEVSCDYSGKNGTSDIQVSGCRYTGDDAPSGAAELYESDPPPTAGTDGVCATGLCPGTFNGTTLCLPCASGVSKSSTTTTTRDASGTVTGSTETTTTTTSGGGPTTTTTTKTTKDASGAVTGTETTESSAPGRGNATGEGEDIGSFCKENPQSPLCKVSSWGGACGGFTCDGDAVQCAIAQEIHARNCALDEAAAPTTGLVGEAKDALAGTPDPTGEAFRNPTPSSIPSMFTTTDLLSGASCPGPWSVSVLSTTFDVSVQPICNLAGLLRTLIIGFALVLGVRIAFSGL